jgi:hypothetical protein
VSDDVWRLGGRDGSAARPAAQELAHRVAASCGEACVELAAALAANASDPACYEASVRGGAAGAPRAGRMMIERASPAVLEAIAAAIDVALPPATSRWIELAGEESVPIIVGWDLRGGGSQRCVKLYVNGSDASRAARARLCGRLAPGAADLGEEPPAVIGMNARSDGIVETKLYVQSADAGARAQGLGARAEALASAAAAESADAGGIVSYDVAADGLRARAFFVALREPPDEAGWQCVRSLPGYDPRTIESLLPFAPAPPRSVGISLGADDRWTLYCKPRGSGRAPEALEPVAIFRLGHAEVGIFIEPTEHAVRAFRRTERHAVSVRVRQGEPAPRALESLVDWFAARLHIAERGSASLAWGDPPAPWRIVKGIELPETPGGPP